MHVLLYILLKSAVSLLAINGNWWLVEGGGAYTNKLHYTIDLYHMISFKKLFSMNKSFHNIYINSLATVIDVYEPLW